MRIMYNASKICSKGPLKKSLGFDTDHDKVDFSGCISSVLCSRQLLHLWNFKKKEKKNLMKRRMTTKSLADYVSKLNGKKER